jgi:dolichyl-diphosphooligosaccharide--protein glycosyltransferase
MRLSMDKKETIIMITSILFIFILGFLIRIDSLYLFGTPDDVKTFFEGSDGLPYMFELDSYYNYRLTENFIEHGYMGDTKINGMEWDMHSYYPPGVPMDYPPLIVYLSAFIYYLINLFASIPLLTVVFWIPVFVGPLSGIVAYFLVRRFTNDFGAIAAGIFIVTAPMFTTRTVAGWFDTDMFNIFFPILVTLLFFMTVDNRENFRRGFLFAVLSAFSMFLYSLAWNGWQYTFYFMMIFSAIYLIWCKYRGRKVKNFIFVYLIFLLSSLIFIGILSGFINVYKLFVAPLELVKISQNPWAPWPDVYNTVAELSKPTIMGIISGIGLAFFAGLFGFIWMFRVMINHKLKNSVLYKMNWFFYSFLLFWAVVGFFTLFKGVRFVMMLIPPMGISAGIFIGIAVEYLAKLKHNQRFDIFKRHNNLVNILAILILIWLSVPAALNVHESISTFKPMANDDMWSVSEWIHNNTSNNTVIISQWGYGHLFTAIADRPVVLDGRIGYVETLPSRSYGNAYPFGDRSPGIYREYWIDKAFSTSNETLSSGIFRMLASSGDLAYLFLNNYTKNTTISVEILNNILGVNKDVASGILINRYRLSQEQADHVLNLTHPDNPHPYVLVTTDGFLGIGGSLFEFGEWDFKKNNGSNIIYSYQKFNTSNSILNTTNGLKMDMNSGTITWNNKTPYKLITITDNSTTQITIDNNSDFIVFLLMNDKRAIIMDKNFENSLFTKLIIERRNTIDFEIVYKTNSAFVWKYKN